LVFGSQSNRAIEGPGVGILQLIQECGDIIESFRHRICPLIA
jgi:hypothetical protein